MSDPTSRGDLPSERDLPPSEDPGELATYDAMPDLDEDDVIDISDNSGPELTTGVADIDSGAAGGRDTAARGDDTGTETPPQALPDDEP
jgi:hypothetical protein